MTALFAWLGDVIRGLWEGIKGLFVQGWGAMLIMAGLVYEGFKIVGDMTIAAMQHLATFFSYGVHGGASYGPCGGSLATILSFANTFFPLDELLRMMAALVFGIWLPLGVYRLIKSWVPGGLAGGS